jgi:hypothetical protein
MVAVAFAAQMLLRLRERTVGGQHVITGDAHHGGSVGLVQAPENTQAPADFISLSRAPSRR